MKMKVLLHILTAALLLPAMTLLLAACRSNSSSDSSARSNNSQTSRTSSSPDQSSTPTVNLTNEKVEIAANSLLGDFRLAGSVRVRGIQELPAQNAAVADLEFQQFEYGVTMEGKILKAKDFNPKPQPTDGSRLPTEEEMFPPRRVSYSKDGKANLARYSDGRWVLKEIRWGFDTGVKGNVEIR